jgi:hypothetical protein
MALTKKSKNWTRVHFLIRLAGVTGLLAAGIGLVLAAEGLTWLGLLLALIGGALAVIGLVVEIKEGVQQVAGQRGAFASNVALQVGLAVLLLIGVNVFSFLHYSRADWTRDHKFTLSHDLRDKLGRLQGDTTIVVYQRHKTFGVMSEKPDAYDYAAERKVVEKVKDVVEQFRELGPKFKVSVLDVEEEGFNAKLDELIDQLVPQFVERARAESPEKRAENIDQLTKEQVKQLRAAIDAVPENSVFFFGSGAMQRLSFNDFYQLDKTASEAANDNKGNLVLLYQGVGPFARRVLNIDEKKPRIALAVVHEVLGFNGSDELGMTGARKTLSAHGFDYRDVVLKKWSGFGPPEPAVFTYDETKYERLDAQEEEAAAGVKNLEDSIKEVKEVIKLWKTATLDELNKKYADQLRGRRLTEGNRRAQLLGLEQDLAIQELVLPQAKEERDAAAREKAGLNVENLAEQRRMADLKAKTDRILADCDLLIVPRMTVFNVSRGEFIPNRVYKLDEGQVAGIKDFIRAGKPVLFCFGPVNQPPDRMDMMEDAAGPDKLEGVLTDLGIQMARQTVLFNVESKSFAEKRGGLLVLGANVEVPPVAFDWAPGAGLPLALAAREDNLKPNPIRQSMLLTAHSLGKDEPLDLRLRAPRPVYYEPRAGTPSFRPDFMMTNPLSWNEDQPFPTGQRTPRFEPPKANDFSRGTVDEKRRGPFPVGLAVETSVPATWYSDKDAKPGTVRVAAIGHGGVFIGTNLSPVREKLLLDVSNWLLGRDDLLTKDEHRWEYPRVALSERQQALWQWGTRLGLPVVFAYLGLVVLMVRRLR